ncbi:MAG: glycosyltransferase, partial [Solirubrobacteraceae bacterium]
DLRWALAARRAAAPLLSLPSAAQPRAVIYSTTTAALLWRRPGAIRFDAPARANRPGRHGLWQRPLERRRLEQAPLLLPLSPGGLAEAGVSPAAAGERALVLPLPVAPSAPREGGQPRDIAAITYAGNPVKKGLDGVLAAWRAVRDAAARHEELVVAGASEPDLRHAGIELAREPGVRSVGLLAHDHFRALLRRSRVFLSAARREDYGQAQLEALADGCMLVTTPAPGPYAALALARELDARLVGEDLAGALAVALRQTPEDAAAYAGRAAAALQPFSPAAVEARVAGELLPRLLG